MLLRKGNASWKGICDQHLLHIWRNGALNIVSRRSWWLCFHACYNSLPKIQDLSSTFPASICYNELFVYRNRILWNCILEQQWQPFFFLPCIPFGGGRMRQNLKRKGLDQILHSYNTYIFLPCCRPSFLTASIFTFLWGGWFMAPGCGSGKTLQSVGSRSSALISVTAPEAWESQIFV